MQHCYTRTPKKVPGDSPLHAGLTPPVWSRSLWFALGRQKTPEDAPRCRETKRRDETRCPETLWDAPRRSPRRPGHDSWRFSFDFSLNLELFWCDFWIMFANTVCFSFFRVISYVVDEFQQLFWGRFSADCGTNPWRTDPWKLQFYGVKTMIFIKLLFSEIQWERAKNEQKMLPNLFGNHSKENTKILV